MIICILVFSGWSAIIGNVDVLLYSNIKSWLPKLHDGRCFAIDFVMMALFIAWISMVVVMVPAALAFRWLFSFPETGGFFVVPLEFSFSIGVGFIIGGVWRLSRIIKGAKNSGQGTGSKVAPL